MALQTEDLVVGDVVKMEQPNLYSREEAVVADGQTLVVGTICTKAAATGQLSALTVEVDEVQLVGITGTLTAGTFTLAFVDDSGVVQITNPIAFDANTAAVQTGVDTALGASKVTVGGTVITAMTFTFDGTNYAGLAQTLIDLDIADLAGEEDSAVERTIAGGAGGNLDLAIALEKVTTSGSTAKIASLERDAIVASTKLAYGSADVTLTDAKLKAQGILVRTSV